MTARVYFVEPADGATVSSPLHLTFKVDGDMDLRPAGDMTPNTGHFAVLIDGRPFPQGEVVPSNTRSLQYGRAQTEADISLPPGQHVLVLQFCDGAYRSYGPELSAAIQINVS